METISKHELVPFTALMNMIKFNYLDKKEIFRTLLGVLGDYDPTDEENKRKTTRYIELLLSDQADLAEYLLSFLPNGMSVDHIGMAEIKEDPSSKLKLKKKKTVKLYKISKSSCENTVPTKTLSTSVTLSEQKVCADSKPKQMLENCKVTSESLCKDTLKLIYSTTAPQISSVPDIPVCASGAVQQEVTSAPSTFQPIEPKPLLKFDSYNDEDLFHEKPSEKYSVKISNHLTGTQSTTPRSSVNIIPSNLPLVYVSNISQAPVCPVTPSVNLQTSLPPNNTKLQCKDNASNSYSSRQVPTFASTDSRETVNEQRILPSPYMTYDNATQSSFTQVFPGVRLEGNPEISNLSTHNIYDPNQYNAMPENFQYLHHKPTPPRFRFPFHSTPKENYLSISQNVKNPKHDILSIINQPMGEQGYHPMDEQHYQPIDEQQYQPPPRDVNNTTRNLSTFPYTHEFVLPNGKIQNLHVNRPGFQTGQNYSHNNVVIKSTNRNHPPGSILDRPLFTIYTDLPMQNINDIRQQTGGQDSTTLFNSHPLQFISAQPRNFPTQSQNNLRTYYTPTQNLYNRPPTNLAETPHDLLTPVQYNQELHSAFQGLSNQSCDSTSSVNKAKPKKLSMSANSTVRKKLRLTPNSSNLP